MRNEKECDSSAALKSDLTFITKNMRLAFFTNIFWCLREDMDSWEVHGESGVRMAQVSIGQKCFIVQI